MEDIKAIEAHCPQVELVSPQVRIGYLEVRSGNEIVNSHAVEMRMDVSRQPFSLKGV